jgi:hypothetical protein
VDALLGQREWQARERAEAGDLWQAQGLVFTTSVGTAYESQPGPGQHRQAMSHPVQRQPAVTQPRAPTQSRSLTLF